MKSFDKISFWLSHGSKFLRHPKWAILAYFPLVFYGVRLVSRRRFDQTGFRNSFTSYKFIILHISYSPSNHQQIEFKTINNTTGINIQFQLFFFLPFLDFHTAVSCIIHETNFLRCCYGLIVLPETDNLNWTNKKKKKKVKKPTVCNSV